MRATLHLDGTVITIFTHEDGDVRIHLPDEMGEEVSLSPTAVQLLAEALQYAVYAATEKTNELH